MGVVAPGEKKQMRLVNPPRCINFYPRPVEWRSDANNSIVWLFYCCAVLCNGSAILCGGATVLCGGATVLCIGATVLCGGATVLCSGTAILCISVTVLCMALLTVRWRYSTVQWLCCTVRWRYCTALSRYWPILSHCHCSLGFHIIFINLRCDSGREISAQQGLFQNTGQHGHSESGVCTHNLRIQVVEELTPLGHIVQNCALYLG